MGRNRHQDSKAALGVANQFCPLGIRAFCSLPSTVPETFSGRGSPGGLGCPSTHHVKETWLKSTR
eukprot:5123967-Amphidinium_carterae.1